MSSNRRWLWLAGVVLLAGLGAGCTSSGGGATTAAAPGFAGAKDAAVPVPKQQEGKQPERPNAAQADVRTVQERKLARTARIELTAPDVSQVTSRAREIAVEAGGFAGAEDSRADVASITLRVPSDRFDAVLGKLSELGRPTVREERAEDVTEQVADVETRVASQRASVDRVRALLARAGSVGEIVQIESELTRREAELESLLGRREALAGKVALSTVTVRVTKQAPPPPPPAEQAGGGFLGGLKAGWDAFLTAASAVLAALGAALPFLVALAIPIAIGIWQYRKRKPTWPRPTKPDPTPAEASS